MLPTTRKAAGQPPFKQGMRALVGAVTVIAAHDASGTPVGITATAVCSLSADPPSLMVSVNRSSTLAPALSRGAGFTVNVLTEHQIDVANAFGGQLGVRGAGKFAYGAWVRTEHDVPRLIDARVVFECEVAEITDWATHHIVIAAVVDVHFGPKAAALVYGDGQYLKVG